MNSKIIIAIILLSILGVGSYFGFQTYQANQEAAVKQELETLKSIPDSQRCVVTIRGEKYDVSTFRDKHPGGNVFKCGEDMTSSFNKQHGEEQIQQIQKYKVSQ